MRLSPKTSTKSVEMLNRTVMVRGGAERLGHEGPTNAVPARLLTPPRKLMKQLRMTEALT